jgi:hypothetical protein
VQEAAGGDLAASPGPGATSDSGVTGWDGRITCPNPLCSALHNNQGGAATAGGGGVTRVGHPVGPEVLDTPAGALVCQAGGAELALKRLQPWEVLEELRLAAQVGWGD